ALNAIREALGDVRVKTGHRLALEERAKKICQLKRNSSLKKYLTEIKCTELREPNVETISAKRLELQPVFVLREVNTDGSNDNEVLNYCGVEEMALRYYRKQGYNEGIHGEGLTFTMLFTLLMWDVIFCDSVPDVFRTPFQASPLDIYSENFYANRKKLIDERLNEIENASVEKLTEWIEAKWKEQEGKTCVGIKWELFSGVRQITGLARCLGSKVIAGICEKFAKDYRHTRSGLPDLVVWNCTDLKYKIVEVKGPNDKLSTKQQVWLDVLVRLGADTEVLYVKAIGGRNL
ncbi:Fanconi-associated nuclease 1, partial [Paramuricea clavata]